MNDFWFLMETDEEVPDRAREDPRRTETKRADLPA